MFRIPETLGKWFTCPGCGSKEICTACGGESGYIQCNGDEEAKHCACDATGTWLRDVAGIHFMILDKDDVTASFETVKNAIAAASPKKRKPPRSRKRR